MGRLLAPRRLLVPGEFAAFAWTILERFTGGAQGWMSQECAVDISLRLMCGPLVENPAQAELGRGTLESRNASWPGQAPAQGAIVILKPAYFAG